MDTSFFGNLVSQTMFCVLNAIYRCSISNVVINTTEWWRQIFGYSPTKMSTIKLDMHILSSFCSILHSNSRSNMWEWTILWPVLDKTSIKCVERFHMYSLIFWYFGTYTTIVIQFVMVNSGWGRCIIVLLDVVVM